MNSSRLVSLLGILTFALTACGGGGGSPLPPSASPVPTSAPSSYAGCPSTATSSSLLDVSPGRAGSASARRMPPKSTSTAVDDEIAVTMAGSADAGIRSAESALRATPVQTLRFDRLGLATHVIRVDPSQMDAALRKMKALPGVSHVSRLHYRHLTSASAVSVNDPYFNGFAANGAPAAGPFYETASVPGQWDMHVINVAQAWGYSQPNTTGSAYPGAESGAPIAIIDTGADLSSPELANAKVIRTKCFVTWNGSQTTGSIVTDTDGHGTNVAGIAAADVQNGKGFVGVGYNSKLMIYRIFPSDPPGGCGLHPDSVQCSTDTADEASAINDAVANGAKVINLSLGGLPQAGNTCAQDDPVESTAVENAIAAGVTVVAAAGNESGGVLDCPAGNVGVIAVGASALNDSNPGNITEDVASYSNYGATNIANSASSWGLVAPGGNPTGNSDNDNLHWIINIYSVNAADLAGQGCGADYQGIADCTAYFAGTSQATPHVAGAAALIAGVKPADTPAQIFAALCNGADSINDPHQGCGRLDVYKALASAINDPSP